MNLKMVYRWVNVHMDGHIDRRPDKETRDFLTYNQDKHTHRDTDTGREKREQFSTILLVEVAQD